MGVAVPKPVKREKKRKPLRRVTSLTPRTYAEARAQMIALRDRVRRRRLRLELNPRAVALVKRGTKHSRRERQWGKMAFLSTQRCDVAAALAELVRHGLGTVFDVALNDDALAAAIEEDDAIGACEGRTEVMHLRDKPGQYRATEDRVAPGCQRHHGKIDGKIGGRGRWYVKLGRLGQIALRNVLTARATAKWMALAPDERVRWDEAADAQRGKWRRG